MNATILKILMCTFQNLLLQSTFIYFRLREQELRCWWYLNGLFLNCSEIEHVPLYFHLLQQTLLGRKSLMCVPIYVTIVSGKK